MAETVALVDAAVEKLTSWRIIEPIPDSLWLSCLKHCVRCMNQILSRQIHADSMQSINDMRFQSLEQKGSLA